MLRSHCPCALCQTDSGQLSGVSMGDDDQPEMLRCGQDGVVEIVFRDGHRSAYNQDDLVLLADWRSRPMPFGFGSRTPLSVERRPWCSNPEPAEVYQWLAAIADNRVLVLDADNLSFSAASWRARRSPVASLNCCRACGGLVALTHASITGRVSATRS
ncbi:MAG: DUF971 domain-containing protein [Mycobacteriaceae bacterium]|nr:DUF971 domain-containing protein [Mycobacteriaceae bacterium]